MTQDPTKAIEGVVTFLNICGLWPNGNQYTVPYTIYAIVFQMVFTFIYTGFKLVNFLFLTEVNLITKSLFICLSEVALFVKVVNFIFYNKELQQMLVFIKEFKLINRLETELYQERQLLYSRILNFQLTMVKLAIFFSCMSPFFSTEPTLPLSSLYIVRMGKVFQVHLILDIQPGIRLIGAMIHSVLSSFISIRLLESFLWLIQSLLRRRMPCT